MSNIKKQTTKTRNAFVNNVSTDIKLIKAQIFNPLARYIVSRIVSNLTSNAINKFERNIYRKRSGKGFTLFISNEVMDDII